MPTASRIKGRSLRVEPLAVDVALTEDSLCVRLADGRKITAPLVWFPRLRGAIQRKLKKWRLIGGGIGINWPDLDEDISVEGLLATK